MRIRRLLIPLLALWGVIALGAFSSCPRGSVPVPDDQPDDPRTAGDSEKTIEYWDRVRDVFVRHSSTSISREEMQRKAQEIRGLSDGSRVWGELAGRYRHSAESAVETAKVIRSLPGEGVDQTATQLGADLAEYVDAQQELYRLSQGQCSEMAALFAAIHAQGDAFDWDSDKGKTYAKQEEAIRGKMEQAVNKQGREEKAQLQKLKSQADRTKSRLERRYGRSFPDILGW